MSMPIKKQSGSPRLSQAGNVLVLLSTIFLLANLFLPRLFSSPIPQILYSLFIQQVQEQEVVVVASGQN